MPRFFLILITFLSVEFTLLPAVEASKPKESVVKIFVTSNPVNYYRPWQSLGSRSSTGSGFIIPGNMILTNAHVVSDSTFIQVRKESDPQKYTAHLEAIGYDCDLALLRVNDPKFFEGLQPLEFGVLPDLQDAVTVIGFPQGGDKLSVTEGVVSRVEIIPYTQSGKQLLAVQIDAAINPGNSGGPVFKDGKVVGVAMQIITSSQNIGYMIPPPVVNHFLTDLKDGKYEGFPTLGIEYNNTENGKLRKLYGIPETDGGVVISYALPFSSSSGHLNKGDIVLKIDGIPIGVDGTFEFRESERLSLSHLITEKQIGDAIDVTLIREGKPQTVSVPLITYVGLVPQPHFYDQPPYYIYGGLVFTVLSADLFQSFGKTWWKDAPVDYMHYLIGQGRLNGNKKNNIVVLLDVLPDDINVGYHSYENEVITKVNGQEFNSFKEFIGLIENNTEDYIKFETDQTAMIILDTHDIDNITQDILQRNSIPSQYSADIKGWFKDKAVTASLSGAGS